MPYFLVKPSPRSYPLLPWNYVFRLLGLVEFEQHHAIFAFPFPPSMPIQKTAWGFRSAEASMFKDLPSEKFDVNPDPPFHPEAVDFWSSIQPLSHSKRVKTLFQTTFQHLDELGVGKAIYKWGLETQDYQLYMRRVKKIHAYDTIIKLLEDWAVVTLFLDHDLQAVYDSTKTQDIIVRWALRGEKTIQRWKKAALDTSHPFLPNLEPETNLKIIGFLLEAEINNRLIEQITQQLTERAENPQSSWEMLLVGGADNIFSIEGQYRTQVKTWRSIQQTLNASERERLEAWMVGMSSHPAYKHLILPISN